MSFYFEKSCSTCICLTLKDPRKPHMVDHVMLDENEKTKKLYVTLQRANGTHIVKDARFRKKVSILIPSIAPYLLAYSLNGPSVVLCNL